MNKQTRLELHAPGDEVVAKANDLVRARHSLTTIEQRIFVLMVADLDRYAEDFPVQTIYLKDVCEAGGGDESHLYSKADEITDRLMSRFVEVRREDEDGVPEFVKYNCFSLCRHKKGSGTIQAKFDEEMRPFLLRLKNKYTLYLVTVFLRLQSKYATQVYELLKMRQGLGRLRMSVEELRRSLGLEEKYDRFRSLRRRVIDRAQREMKEKADVAFDYRIDRDGQTPVAVEFVIYPNREQIRQLEDELGRSSLKQQTADGPTAIDARQLFSDMLPEESSATSQEIDRLYERAKSESDMRFQSQAYEAGVLYRKMKTLWEER